ncbi:MAG: MarR family transcriptional regulator [Deltaproteobacteria bacterium]|nr:MarR family transcriptional regulator [Deltaproteobacteria bacterium]
MAVSRLAEVLAAHTISELRRGGREIGYALVRRDAEVVEELTDEVDRARATDPPDASPDFARGYRAALADALAGFAAALDSQLQLERAVGELGRRDHDVLRALAHEARPQVRIGRELGMPAHEVSRATKRLRDAGLIAAYPGLREIEKLHRVTALGRAALRALDARADADVASAAGTPPIRARTRSSHPPVAYAELAAWPQASTPMPAAAPAPASAVRELDAETSRWRNSGDDSDDE